MVVLLAVANGLNLSLEFERSRDPLHDIRFYGLAIGVIATIVAGPLQHFEWTRSKRPSSRLSVYWLITALGGASKVYALVLRHYPKKHLPDFSVQCFTVGITLLLLLIENQRRRDISYISLDEDPKECPVDRANIFSRITFGWMTPMMVLGKKKFLTEDDLWSLPKGDKAPILAEKFQVTWRKQLMRKKPSLFRAIVAAYGWPYLQAAFFKAGQDILSFTQPQLLRLLIAFVTTLGTDEPHDMSQGYYIALAMFFVSVLQTTLLHQYFQRCFETGMRIKAGLVSAVYRKTLILSTDGRKSKTTGEIVTLMSVDAQRIQDVCTYGQTIWSAPFQILLALVSLYNLLGWSMFAGVVVMLLMIPVNTFMARIIKKFKKKQMKCKDDRTRLMNEILNNIKSIKLYAWESAFGKKLSAIRNDREIVLLRKLGVYSAISVSLFGLTPVLVTFSTFTLYSLTGHVLNSSTIFPALTLFTLLQFPIAMLAQVVTNIIEASVAIQRLGEFLGADELQPDAVKYEPYDGNKNSEMVVVENASFKWNSESKDPFLKNINLTARRGELLAIVGRVGCGKSSLMSACLGELIKTSGSVTLRGAVAYVAQQPFIMNGTVKENITFGHKFDPNFYEATLDACELRRDLSILPYGDATEVGEKGLSLSGGQKARLSLARALYARADVYLIDDVLSALDAHVGRHVFDHVLGPDGLLKGKCRVFTTNNIPFLAQSDHIMMIKEGEIVERGTFKQVMEEKKALYQLINEFGRERKEEDTSSDQETVVEDVENTALSTSPELNQFEDQIKPTQRRISTITLRRASMASLRHATRAIKTEDRNESGQPNGSIITKERQEQGKVKWHVYKTYIKACSPIGVATYMIMAIAAQASQVSMTYWLKYWADSNTQSDSNDNLWYFVGIYFAIGMSYILFSLISTSTLWVLCSVRSAKRMHDGMAEAVFRAPMSFFETTPIGRILNIFSRDLSVIDEVLAYVFSGFFRTLFSVFSVLLVISASTPLFIALLIPLLFFYRYIQSYYLRTSRELKRLDSTSRSPIFAHFQESLGGLSTIRAYKQQQRFLAESEDRVGHNLEAYFPSMTSNRWLAVRLEFLGSLIILGASSLSIFSSLDPALCGLALSYALSTTQSLNWVVRSSTEVETNIVSVERCEQYTELEPEAPLVVQDNRPPVVWPNKGAVSFEDYSTRYRPGLPLVLKGISVDIKPREKIGIVGRTGAGKSSLTLALFRIIEKAGGEIKIDGVDISKIGLYDLRSRLSIIPQDPQLFEGTIRENLDPAGMHEDVELWKVLEAANLKDHVVKMDGKLSAAVSENGDNLSLGQRQLICLARALLNDSTILVLDEATSAIDYETEQLIQATIRKSFKDRTILSIAHRIAGIMDNDRILVLDDGKVAEFASPEELLHDKNSIFYSLAKQGGAIKDAE